MSEKSRLPVLQGYGIDNVLRILEPLKNSENGNLLYRHVTHTLIELERNQAKLSLGYATILHNFIFALRKHLPKASLLNIELRIIQQRLRPPITLTEMAAIQNYLRKAIDLISEVSPHDEKVWAEAIKPLTESLTGQESHIRHPHSDEQDEPTQNEIDLNMQSSAQIDVSSLRKKLQEQANKPARTEKSLQGNQQEGDAEKSADDTIFEKQQGNLMNSIVESMQHQARFGLLLEEILQRLNKADTRQDIHGIRSYAISQLQGMLTKQSQLVRTLNETHDFATLVRQNNARLSQELNHIRILSLTDELTELPNRRAFMQRLDDEIGRAKRYHTQFCIALLDLDNFKEINDSYGHPAGDMTLRDYASKILTLFRRTDLIARYGGEEFAIIFPNESIDESLYALEKVRRKANNTSISYEDHKFKAPSFSAGLVSWSKEESPEELINRADTLLYVAKNKGGNCIETSVDEVQGEAANNE